MPVSEELAPDFNAFADLVESIIDQLPAEATRDLENIVFLIEDTPPADEPPNLLGRYLGVPVTEKGFTISGELPDNITIYRIPHLQKVNTLDELHAEIRTTLLHEIGHYYGLSEERLHELGWG